MFTIYSKSDCLYCQKAKALLDWAKIPWRELDASSSLENKDFVRAYWESVGKRPTVPLILDDKNLPIGGYDDLAERFASKA